MSSPPLGLSRTRWASSDPIGALGLNFTCFLLAVTSSRVWLEGLRWYWAQSITRRSIRGLLEDTRREDTHNTGNKNAHMLS